MSAVRLSAGGQRVGSMRVARLAVGALVAIAAAVTSATALASEPNTQSLPPSVPGGLAAAPARIELGVLPGTSDLEQDVAVTNRGPQPAHVHAELSDLVITRADAYDAVPAGQTPYSASQLAHIDVEDLDLDAAGSPAATGTVRLLVNADRLDRPLYGALSLELADSSAPTVDLGEVRVSPQLHPSILIPVMFVPLSDTGGSGAADRPEGSSQLAQSIQLDVRGLSLAVVQRDDHGWLDRVIPVSIPGVADHGPLLATAELQNSGNAFGRAFTTYDFSGVSPFGWLPESARGALAFEERPFLNVDTAPAALMPDMIGQTHAATTYPTGRGAEVDTTPWFGVVRVRAITKLVLADFASAPVVQETYVLVLPWKEGLVLLGALIMLSALRRWRRQVRSHPRGDGPAVERVGSSKPAVPV
jgi:hypothetical protein